MAFQIATQFITAFFQNSNKSNTNSDSTSKNIKKRTNDTALKKMKEGDLDKKNPSALFSKNKTTTQSKEPSNDSSNRKTDEITLNTRNVENITPRPTVKKIRILQKNSNITTYKVYNSKSGIFEESD